jgi:hypothetical protein
MDDMEQGSAAIATKTKGPAIASPSSGSKLANNRIASKQRKKRAHKRTLRRSNTNG